MSSALALVIVAPLLSGIFAYLIDRGGRKTLAAATSLIVLGSTAALAIEVWHGGPMRSDLGGWGVPLGIGLYADGLSVFMLGTIAVVGSVITLFGLGYYAADNEISSSIHETRLFWPLWFILWAALNALFVAADLFNIYVVFELMGLAAIAMITTAGKPDALTAAMRYLIAAFLGSLSYLFGVGLLYAQYGVLDLFLLRDVVAATPSSLAALALMTAGLALKTALFPLHFWLPPAHSSASAPVSAILSALVVKGSFFILLRLWFEVFSNVSLAGAGQLLGVLGCVAILWGSMEAIRQRRLKLLVAYSTVAQLGYLFLLFPLTSAAISDSNDAPWLDEALVGSMYQIASHALAKGAMFLAAGMVLHAYGSDELHLMRGMLRVMPITSSALAIAGVSLIGLPPSGGFAAKFLIMKAALGSGQWWWTPVIGVGGLMTAGYIALILRYVFQITDPPPEPKPLRKSMELAAVLLAILSVLIGFRLEEPLELLLIGAPFSNVGGARQ